MIQEGDSIVVVGGKYKGLQGVVVKAHTPVKVTLSLETVRKNVCIPKSNVSVHAVEEDATRSPKVQNDSVGSPPTADRKNEAMTPDLISILKVKAPTPMPEIVQEKESTGEEEPKKSVSFESLKNHPGEDAFWNQTRSTENKDDKRKVVVMSPPEKKAKRNENSRWARSPGGGSAYTWYQSPPEWEPATSTEPRPFSCKGKTAKQLKGLIFEALSH